jgi:thioredoxin 2
MEKSNYLFRCSECGTRNKIPMEKIGVRAACGKCKAIMNTAELLEDKPVIVTDGNFHDKVEKSPLPVLLDCWAPWCGPCKMMGPVFDELAREWKGRVRVCKINIDENQVIAGRFQVMSIPTILVFDRGIQKDSMIGAVPKQQIITKMASYLS